MGAGTTEVRDTTTDLMLEAAVAGSAAVSRTQRRLHLTSESGRRYERTAWIQRSPSPRWTGLPRCWPISQAAQSNPS